MPSANGSVLLLDAHLRHSVAIARSLGRQGVEVVGAAPSRRFAARYSRYVQTAVQFDAGADGQDPGHLLAIAERHRVGTVIAGGLPGNEFLCRHRGLLEGRLRAPFNDLSQFERLANKRATVELADSLGVRHPLTVEVEHPDQASEIAAQVGFPMVLKSPIDQGTVRYPADAVALEACIAQYATDNPQEYRNGVYPIAQRYIDGDGHGFFGLADHGRLVAYFMHRRLHEVPPSGGPSAMAMSWRDPELLALGQRFFSATGWHGVAMVEFKRSRSDGAYDLIEVNPKFWGSLDLAIASGVDFPALLHALLEQAPLTHLIGDYRDGTIFRWLTMDLAHAAARRDLRPYLRAFADPRIRDDLEPRDPFPTAALFATGLARVMRSGAGRSSSNRAGRQP